MQIAAFQLHHALPKAWSTKPRFPRMHAARVQEAACTQKLKTCTKCHVQYVVKQMHRTNILCPTCKGSEAERSKRRRAGAKEIASPSAPRLAHRLRWACSSSSYAAPSSRPPPSSRSATSPLLQRSRRCEVNCILCVPGWSLGGSVGRNGPTPNFRRSARGVGSVGRTARPKNFRRAARGQVGRSEQPDPALLLRPVQLGRAVGTPRLVEDRRTAHNLRSVGRITC